MSRGGSAAWAVGIEAAGIKSEKAKRRATSIARMGKHSRKFFRSGCCARPHSNRGSDAPNDGSNNDEVRAQRLQMRNLGSDFSRQTFGCEGVSPPDVRHCERSEAIH